MMSKTKKSPHAKKSAGLLTFMGIGCLFFGLLILGAAVVAMSLGPDAINLFGNGQAATLPSGLGDNTSPERLHAQREKAETQLNDYGWVDKEAEVVRIPIQQAMELVAERGLPVGSVEEAAPQEEVTPAPEVETEAPVEEPALAEAAPATSEAAAETEAPAEEPPVAEAAPATSEAAAETEAPAEATAAATEEAAPATAEPEGEGEPAATEEPPAAEPEVNLAEVSFQQHVLPIFEQNCLKCHGGEEMEEGLDLSTVESIMAGSWNGSVVEPGDLENSYLIEQIVTGRMPKDAPDLSPTEIEIISAWVENGAPDN
jgi:hypothetical protein